MRLIARLLRNRYLQIFVVAFFALVAGGMVWLHYNLDHIVAQAIRDYGKDMLGTRVEVNDVDIRPTDGKGSIHSVIIHSPKGFSEPYVLKLREVSFEVEARTLRDPVIHIIAVHIVAPDIIYEKRQNFSNIDALQKNINTYLGPSGDEPSNPKRLIIDEFRITSAHAQACAPDLANIRASATVPDIILRDVGKAQGGITPGQFGQLLASTIEKRVVATLNPTKLLTPSGNKLDKLGNTVKGWFGK